MSRYYRTPVHITLLEALEYELAVTTYVCESILEGRTNMQSSVQTHFGLAMRCGEILKTSCFADAERVEIISALGRMKGAYGPVLERHWKWYSGRKQVPPHDEWLERSPPRWLDELIREMRKPDYPLLRPTVPPVVLEPTAPMRGKRNFLKSANLTRQECAELLEKLPSRLREKMATLLRGKNMPLQVCPARIYMSHDPSWSNRFGEWRNWRDSVNIALRNLTFGEKQFCLVMRDHPLGEYVQLWEVTRSSRQ